MIWLDRVPILPQATQGASVENSKSDELGDDQNNVEDDAASVASIDRNNCKIESHHLLSKVHSQKFFEEDLP